MRRNRLSAALLAAALASGCRPPNQEPAPEGAAAPLEAPAASSTILAGLPDGASAGYSNEQQARYLREEAARLGITYLQTGEDSAQDEVVTYEEAMARTQFLSERLASQRQALDEKKARPLHLLGSTPALLHTEDPKTKYNPAGPP